MIDYSKFVENSRKWLSQYIKDNHLQSICVGISGRVDSTVSCAIAKPVCDALNIPLIGRSLPTTTNKPDENDVAVLVGNAFCSDFKSVCCFIFLLVGGFIGCPYYNVWEQEMSGKAEFAKAEQNRKIRIEEAKANLESEKLNAQAEVERAKGAAEAIKIENELSLLHIFNIFG